MKPEGLAKCYQTLSSWVGSGHETIGGHAWSSCIPGLYCIQGIKMADGLDVK